MDASVIVNALLIAEAETPNCGLRLYVGNQSIVLKKWEILRGGVKGESVIGITGITTVLDDKKKLMESTTFSICALSGVGIVSEAPVDKLMRNVTSRFARA